MKRLLFVISILALVVSLVLRVEAHPGRTDGAGGHTDHSTGEYHYHHGYSAHQHYDMDGDGKADCPYNFKDKTTHGSGNSNTSKDNVQQPTTQIKSNNVKEEKSDKFDADLIVKIVIAVIVLVFWLAPLFFSKKRR